MKYTEHEQLQQVLLRADLLRQRRELRVLKGLPASAAALLFMLMALIGSLGRVGLSEARTLYGAFLLSPETGGYVLVAVLAFAFGVVITVLLTEHKKKSGGNEI